MENEYQRNYAIISGKQFHLSVVFYETKEDAKKAAEHWTHNYMIVKVEEIDKF